ncbi:MAG: hypothetical protein M2R45_05277 [Verrucomicrobia subdivision 3 bacterium]|nr:hypothetical protein [Limisphaerales bacterium]MCS1417475.1 hypothetical protein [Limisphaerales bacterium]
MGERFQDARTENLMDLTMLRFIRIFGFLLIWAGALVLLSYLIKPLRELWPLFLRLPLPIQIGLGAAAVGTILLMGTVIWERLKSRGSDKELEDKE